MKVKAVLFDLDGVLLDSIEAWCNTFNDVLVYYKQEPLTLEVFIRDVLGEPLEDDVEFFPGSTPEKVVELYGEYFPKHASDVKAFDGAIDLLKYLRENNIKTALVTNTPRNLTAKSLKTSGLEGLLDIVKTPDDVPNGKPDPAMLNAALIELGIEKEDAVMVGDTKVDLMAAEAAGVKVVGVGIQGDEKISTVRELREIIE